VYTHSHRMVHKGALELELADDSVKVMTNTTGVAVTKEGLLCKDRDGNEVLYPADTVICAVGYASTNPAVEELRFAALDVHIIADAQRPGKVKDAITIGYWMGLDL
jgi:hypothetical protein